MGPRGGKRIDNDKKTTKRWRNGEAHNSKRWPETDEFKLKWEQQVQVKTKNKNKQAQEGFKWDPVTAVNWHVLHSLSAKRRKRTTKQPKQQDESTGAVGCPLMPFFRKGSMLGSESWSTLMKSQRRRRWISAMHGLLQQLPQWLQHDDNYNRRDALNIMSDLPSSWPSCRLCINADAVATSYLAGLHRLFLEAKLAEKDHQTALQEANARAYEMETICLDPLARHLHQLFHTDDDLFFDVYPEEWKQLQRLDFWRLSLMQEVSRIRRFIDKSTGKANLPQKTIEGVVHLQPRLHAPVDSLPTLIVIVTFPVTYLKVVLPLLPPLQSTIVAPQTKHFQHLQPVAHGNRSTSLRSPSARLPTSPGCVLCRPPPPRRSRPRHPSPLY